MSKKKTEMTEIEKFICSKFENTQIPEKITIDNNGEAITIALDRKMIVEDNMQVVGNAFEGWALVAHICSQKNVILSVNDCENLPSGNYIGHGHFSRFIYRIMKFSEQYTWFSLDKDLENEVTKFVNFLNEHKHDLHNNYPTTEASDCNQINNENSIEAILEGKDVLRKVLGDKLIGNGLVHRQLPVGLFCGDKSKDNAVFTYGHSAIDLWNKNGETINVIELKYKNNMIGIITEIFFYSNYILDLVGDDGLFNLAKNDGKNNRGYDDLKERINNVNGIMLADSYHPCVNARVKDELNRNGKLAGRLIYYIAKYHADVTIDKMTMRIEVQKD